MQRFHAAFVYFAVVFAAGFAFGAVRVPLLVPRLGVRAAELVEMPFLLVAIVLLSRWRQRQTPELSPAAQLGVGMLALGMMLAAECAVGFGVAGQDPLESLLAHDPVSGSVYYAALVAFALAPWGWALRARRAAPSQRV